MVIRQRDIELELTEFEREEFFQERWNYSPGQHVTVLGPTGCGKTYLMLDALQHTATKDLKAMVLIVKPKDETIKEWNETLNYPVIDDWPPTHFQRLKFRDRKGWIVWPKHVFDPKKDNEHLGAVHKRAILAGWEEGNKIIVADECFGLVARQKLGDELIEVWTKGRSMGTGLWVGSQKPTHIPTWAYDQAHHLFLAHDPDERARKRFREIGGVNSREVEDIVADLGDKEFLYIRRAEGKEGPVMCRIAP